MDSEANGRISKLSQYINTIRNEHEISENDQHKSTEKAIVYFQKHSDDIYETIEQDTKAIKREQREAMEKQKRNSEIDSDILGIGRDF